MLTANKFCSCTASVEVGIAPFIANAPQAIDPSPPSLVSTAIEEIPGIAEIAAIRGGGFRSANVTEIAHKPSCLLSTDAQGENAVELMQGSKQSTQTL